MRRREEVFWLRPSRRLLALLLIAHAAFLGGVFFLTWPLLVRGVLAVCVAASGWVAWRRTTGPNRVRRLRFDGSGEVGVEFGDGRLVTTAVASGTTVWPGLAVVRFAWPQRRAAVVLADSLEPADFRRLRVRLRWGLGGRPEVSAPS